MLIIMTSITKHTDLNTAHTDRETWASWMHRRILPIASLVAISGTFYFSRNRIGQASQKAVTYYENFNQYLVAHPVANDFLKAVIAPVTQPALTLATMIMDRSIGRVSAYYYIPLIKSIKKRVLRIFGCEYEEDIPTQDFTRTDVDATRDLTLQARRNNLPRTKKRNEIEKAILNALACHTKPNVLLVGNPGSGKSAIVESLAYALAKEPQSHRALQDCTLRSVGFSDFVGDQTYTTQRKIQSFLNSQRSSEQVILAFDEFDCGNPQNSIAPTLITMLKPLLARNAIRILGCLTTEEYVRLQKVDSAFLRRFTVVNVPEPSGDTLIEILHLHVQKYAEHHQCEYAPESIQAAVDTTRDLPGSYPDKALSLLDRAGAAVRMQSASDHKSKDLPQVTALDIFLA